MAEVAVDGGMEDPLVAFHALIRAARAVGPDGFFATGDIGIIDQCGAIRIVLHKKDMILVSGFNVYPNEVENVLFQHHCILEVSVVGAVDSQSGETPVACVVKKDPALTEEEVIGFARKALAAYKVPKRLGIRGRFADNAGWQSAPTAIAGPVRESNLTPRTYA